MRYDFLFVGAGITAATMCACLKSKFKILVLDIRNHIGGNCYDCKVGNNYTQSYGPHIFHTKNLNIFKFLSNYTEWIDYQYSVTAEIYQDGTLKRVPFPYSEETKLITGNLTKKQVIDLFFKGYSQKMWDMPFEDLPKSIKARVPKKLISSNYFPGQIQSQPKLGYTQMIENMFDGVDVQLNVDPNMWKEVKASKVFYAGRPDLLINNMNLGFRTIKFRWKHELWDAETTSVNFCHLNRKSVRKTNYGFFYNNKDAKTISYETPYKADDKDMVPYYPIPTKENINKYKKIKKIIKIEIPNLEFIGRLGLYSYINMDQAVMNGLNMVNKYEIQTVV